MNDLIYIPTTTLPKFNVDPLRRDWNDFQHNSSQGRYIVPRTFSEYRPQRYRLTAVKKQLYNPKVPSIRHMERDEVLCRLPEEHCRHTSTYTEEQFENWDPTKDGTFVEFTGLGVSQAGKTLLGENDNLPEQREPWTAFGHRLRADKSQRDAQSATTAYRSSSLTHLPSTSSINKPINYSYRNYGRGTYDTSTKHTMWPRYHMNTKNSFDSINRLPMPSNMQNVFRSASMYNGVYNTPWK
ncbi:unnamed protein product [Adineta steineri]|uniref:Uncharacterized protein n=1 Tax=Adineta steineri TaxID=433720 RepID=A0A813VI88_9BILA|nr:unnamed protein product [Adineta steineri]CAF0866056.1 unnamed protein product [Adineta steineri]CAF0931782.1 unnamed protein product [Adineta steineri]